MNQRIKIETETGYIIAETENCLFCPNKVQTIAIIAHGLAGYKEEPMLQCLKNCFLKHGISVFMYDAQHSLGESSGSLSEACFSGFIADLNCVMSWIKQHLKINSFLLAGHSLGAGACLHYAAEHPTEIKGVISLSAVYNGYLLRESYLTNKPEFMAEWQQKKLIYREHPNQPDKNGYISIRHLDDALQYAVEKDVYTIKSPVLILCGDHDVSSTIAINEKLRDSFSGNATLQIIENCGHTYSKAQNQKDLIDFVSKWITLYL